MTVLLHIGTHKTGTTSIQRFFSRHRKRLRQNGVWYPDFAEFGRRSHYAHHDLAHAVAGADTPLVTASEVEEFCGELLSRRGPEEVMLISAEPMWRRVAENPPPGVVERGDAAGYWSRRRDYVARVARCFRGADVEVVAVLRRQHEFAAALFAENVKVRRYSEGFTRFLSRFDQSMRYAEQLGIWGDHFPRLRVLVYEDLVASGDLVREFARRLELPVGARWPQPGRLNKSMPPDVIEFKRRLNGTSLSLEDLRTIGALLQRDDFVQSIGLPRQRTTWIKPESLAARLERYECGNARVFDRWAPTSERTQLFPGKHSAASAYWGLSRSTTRSICRAIERHAEPAQLDAELVDRVFELMWNLRST